VLFFPLALQLIENAKFYFSSREVKIQEIQWMLMQGDYFAFSPKFMWFDPIWHVYAKLVLYLCSFVAMVYFYIRFRSDVRYDGLFEKPVFTYWVRGILVFRLFTVVYILYTFILVTDGKVTFINTDYLLIAEFVFHIVFLVANPKFLDVQILSKHLQEDNAMEEVVSVRDEERLQEIASKVEQCFVTEQVFLNSQLSAELLGSLTGYPHRMIGQAIKWKYNMSFRDYLNNYRIRYIEEMLSDPQLLQKTSIEAIAEASGFGSRQSFYTAVRKAKGCTPKEYFTSKKG
jgi:AraC-like DNA-binding protein